MPNAVSPDQQSPSYIQPRTHQRSQQQFKLESVDPDHQVSQDHATASPSAERDPQVRPPAKRARKAINCEPCRSSKLKCDRGKPCSSCVLRGTALLCYQGASNELHDDQRANKIDPHQEIAQIRQSLATLEAYVTRSGANAVQASSMPRVSAVSPGTPKKHTVDGDELLNQSAPCMLAQRGRGGLYAGPTSMVTHLLSFRSPEGHANADNGGDDSSRSGDEASPLRHEQARSYDDDLLALLPQLHIIDGLIDFYFEYCNWMYRHIYPRTFLAAWQKFKSGQSPDRLVLASLCVIMALAIRYLPERHALLASLPQSREELGERYYEISRDALSRYRTESRAFSLELVELLLIRTHYLTLSKNDAEEIWAIRGELVSIGTAMGLHRDPAKWGMPREVAERRRWAWWYIVHLDRWQCFLFGRPLSIASHHFDTRMPSYVDPDVDPSGRLFHPILHFFRLAYILGDIVDDAVSIRPVPYERVQKHDRELVVWMQDLPKELDLDEYRLARALASPLPAAMRIGVQSIIIRASYYHIRFSLHRPYAAAAHDNQRLSRAKSANGNETSIEECMSRSLDAAVSAADKLIQLVNQARPELLANSSLAVPGHVHWMPFHNFSAAMFFSFQLIANPDQPGANLFRANIRRALDFLNMSRGVAIADKAVNMLTALAPLYESPPPGETLEQRENKKKQVLHLVKSLAFPYHDSPAYPRSHVDSPMRRSVREYSPLQASSSSPPSTVQGILPSIAQHSLSSQMSLNGSTTDLSNAGLDTVPPTYAQTAPHVQQSIRAYTSFSPYHPTPTTLATNANPVDSSAHSYSAQTQQVLAPYTAQPPEYGDTPYVQSSDASMWGASVGFGQGEWQRFLDVMQRSDASRI